MKTKLLIFLLALFFFASCQKNSDQDSLERNKEVSAELIKNQIDPSIESSNWYRQYPELTKYMIALEISGQDSPMTFAELKTLIAESQRRRKATNMRASICPGFPSPNPEGNVTLSSQADVDAFGALKCKEITGELVAVDTLGPDPICDLTPLSKIKTIGSSLTIQSNCLTSLAGLEKLKSIGELGPFGFIGIAGDNITDIEALAGLKTITGSINVTSCPGLIQITNAFSNITEIASGKTSAPLTSFYVLNINNNANLSDISGFGNIDFIEGRIMFSNNGALTDLDDLSSLTDIGNAIYLYNNTAMTQIDRLSVISSLNDYLIVEDNTSLTSCCGLYNVLCSNPPTCDMTGVISGAVLINNNGSGCTISDIIAGGPCAP